MSGEFYVIEEFIPPPSGRDWWKVPRIVISDLTLPEAQEFIANVDPEKTRILRIAKRRNS